MQQDKPFIKKLQFNGSVSKLQIALLWKELDIIQNSISLSVLQQDGYIYILSTLPDDFCKKA